MSTPTGEKEHCFILKFKYKLNYKLKCFKTFATNSLLHLYFCVAKYLFILSVETCTNGASGSSDHCHAVHSGVGKKPQGGPSWLLSSIF